MINKVVDLEKERSRNLLIYKQNALRKLLRDKVIHVSSYIELIVNNFNVNLSTSTPFQLILLKIDKFNEFCAANSPGRQEILKLKIVEMAKQIEDDSIFEAVDMENDQVVVFIKTEGSSTAQVDINPFSYCLQLQEYARQNFNLSFSCFISKIANGLNEVQLVYNECIGISHYRIVFGYNSIIDSNMITKRLEKRYQYPDNLEKKFIQNILAYKTKKAGEIADEIIDDVSGYSCTDFTTAISFIAHALDRALDIINTNTSMQLHHEFSDFIAQIDNAETSTEVKSHFHLFLLSIGNTMEQWNSNKHIRLIESISELVSQQFRDVNLGIESIAEQLNMSPAYVGRIFKSMTSETLTYHINRLRMKEVDRILKETTLSINEAAVEAGYSNIQHFYSTFKIFHGITPGEFRKMKL